MKEDESGLYLGIDGGGSKTEAVLCAISGRDEIHPVWRGEGPAVNWLGTGDADERMTGTLTELCRAAQEHGSGRVRAVVAGVAGAQLPGRRCRAAAALQTHFPARTCGVITDAEAAHWAGGPQLCRRATVISGTGSVALARSGGTWVTAGGHGIILADEGSAFWIGRAGLRAAVRHEEGRGEAPLLYRYARGHFGVGHLTELVPRVHRSWGLDIGAVAGFAPEVFRAARRAEPAAGQILNRAGEDLATLVSSLERRKAGPISTVHLAGGCWRGGLPLLRPFCRALWRRLGPVGVASTVASPAEGAALCARYWESRRRQRGGDGA